MPVLPLPGECELKAITKFRHQRREARLHQQYMDTGGSDFEFEPFGEAVAQPNSPSARVEMMDEHFSDKELDLEVPSTSGASDGRVTTKLDTADPQKPNPSSIATPTSFEVLARGAGFLAINTTIEGCEFSGMLFKTERPSTSSNLPAVFSPDARQKFINLCQQDEVDVVADQWVSMLTTRQLLPSRQRRTCSASWAKRQGRMLCYSCLCVVPQEHSMPFACKCRERQRQRASRLKCGYLPPKNRLVVVGKANRTPKSNGQPSLSCASRKISNQTLAINGEEVHKTSDDKPSVSPLQPAYAEENGIVDGLKEVSSPSDSNTVQEDKCNDSLPKELTPLSIVINGESDAKEVVLETQLSDGLEKLINQDPCPLPADLTCKNADTSPFPCKSSPSNGEKKAVSVKRKKNSNGSGPTKKRKSQSLSNPTWIQARKAEEKEFSQPCLPTPTTKQRQTAVICKSESHERKPEVDGQAKKICSTPLSKSFLQSSGSPAN